MKQATFKLSGTAVALAAAFGSAQAVEPIVAANVDPAAPASLHVDASTASVGLGYATDDARRFGQYNGINEDGFYEVVLEVQQRNHTVLLPVAETVLIFNDALPTVATDFEVER